MQVGKTELRYQLRCLDDLHAMLKKRGDWVPLGAADSAIQRRADGGRDASPLPPLVLARMH